MNTKSNCNTKAAVLCAAILALAAWNSSAQTNESNQATPRDAAATPTSAGPGTNQLQKANLKSAAAKSSVEVVWPTAGAVRNRKLSERVTYGGVVGEIIKSDNPLQFINPFAPASYGNGEEMLSLDPHTRQANGIALFSVRF